LRTIPSGLREEGEDISRSTFVEKAEVVATLRSRELHGRADWVDRELPPFIDTSKNAALLRTLGIDVAAMSPRIRSDRDVALEHSRH
jgi:hypothetical protein